jgi:acyl-coenzyme A thioesterase PaaI-like protein
MKIKSHFKQLPTSSDHNCFACSPVNQAGLRMNFFAHEDAVFSRVTIPEHLCGWNNVAHGGVVSTILDETMSWAGMYLLKRVSLTQALTVEFQKPVIICTLMEAECRIKALKGKREAVIEGVLTDTDEKVFATSVGTFQTFSPAVARRLKIADDNMLAWFHRLFETG